MNAHSEVIWLTLIGLSLLFVGGFVLWVYGAQIPRSNAAPSGPEADAVRKLHSHYVQWFLLYGAGAAFAGLGCLLTAGMIIL